MSDKRFQKTLIATVTGLLLILPLLSVNPAGASSVGSGNEAAIDNALGHDPLGSWRHRDEVAQFYLHKDPDNTIEDPSGTIGGIGGGSAPTMWMDMARPTHQPTSMDSGAGLALEPGETVTFDYEVPNGVTAAIEGDLKIKGFEATFFASETTAATEFDVVVYRLSGGSATEVEDFTLTRAFGPSSPAPTLDEILDDEGLTLSVETFQGSQNVPFPYITLQEGDSIRIDVTPVTTGATLRMDRGTPSHFDVRADSGRVNVWTEDYLGDEADAFPSPYRRKVADDPTKDVPENVDNREVVLFIAQTSAWGAEMMRDDGPGYRHLNNHLSADDNQDNVARPEERNIRILNPGGDDVTDDFEYRQNAALTAPTPPVGQSWMVYRHHLAYPAPTDQDGAPVDAQDNPIQIPSGGTAEDARENWHVPDGNYQMQVFSDQGWVIDHDISIGMTGFDYDLIGFHTHETLLKEPTEFLFSLRNTGRFNDEYGISVPAAGGWRTEISDPLVRLAPNEDETFWVRMTPPDNGGAGDFRVFDVNVVSLASNEVKTIQVNVTLTATERFGVDIFSIEEEVEIRPTLTNHFPATVMNTGNSKQTYVLDTDCECPGWDFRLSSTTIDILSQSIQEVTVIADAPPDAEPGDVFTLELTATQIDNSSVRDRELIPITVFQLDRVYTELLDGSTPTFATRELRNRGANSASNVEFDRDYDQSALYRMRIDNLGDREDTFTLTGSWNPDVGTDLCDQQENLIDSDGDNSGDGVPDGWVFNTDPRLNPGGTYPAQTGFTNGRVTIGATNQGYGVSSSFDDETNDQIQTGFSGIYDVGEVTLGAGDSTYVYFELGYFRTGADARSDDTETCIQVTGAGGAGLITGSGDSSSEAQFDFTLRSANDPTIVRTHSLKGERAGAGGYVERNVYTQAARGVLLEPDIIQPQAGNGTLGGQFQVESLGVVAGNNPTSSVYHLRTTNQAHEYDTLNLRAELPVAAGLAGWTIDLRQGATAGALDVDDLLHDRPQHDSRDDPAGCIRHNSQPALFCTGGVYDEAGIEVEITPPTDAEVGDIVEFEVAVTSDDDATLFDTMQLTARVVGDLDFGLLRHGPQRDLSVDGSAAFPFTIDNTGLQGDEYELEADGPSDWGASLSHSRFFVPGEHQGQAFLAVTPPDDVSVGESASFQVHVTSTANGRSEFANFVATVRATPSLNMTSMPVQGAELLGTSRPGVILPGGELEMQIVLEDLTGSADSVELTIDCDLLPDGWELGFGTPCQNLPAGSTRTTTVAFTETMVPDRNLAVQGLTVVAPDDALGASRLLLAVDAETDDGVSWSHDLGVNLASTFGVVLDAPLGVEQPIAAGGTVTYLLDVTNGGSAVDVIELSAPDLPEGWKVSFDESSPRVRALETVSTIVTVSAPEDANAGDAASLVVFGRSKGDPTKAGEVTLTPRVGFFDLGLQVDSPTGEDVYGAPGETLRYQVRLTNDGTVHDTVQLNLTTPDDQGVNVREKLGQSTVQLAPGQTRHVSLEYTIPKSVQPCFVLRVDVEATSALAEASYNEVAGAKATVLGHVSQDIDDDGIDEFAIDRDREITCFESTSARAGKNVSFEQFSDPSSVGVQLTQPDLVRFLTGEAREAKGLEANSTEPYLLDADGDGRADHLLDSNADGFPDIFWDPDARVSTSLDVAFDVTEDSVQEYFIDVNGNGRLDVWFDLTTGEFGKLIQEFIDGDDPIDYIVDLNGNGVADEGEPILLGKLDGTMLAAQMRDVDGDGVLDLVVDENGDGTPDRFISGKSGKAFRIDASRDYDNDGQNDWAYDSDGDGRLDSYYSPESGRSAAIDTRSEFVRSLQNFWYVGAAFGIVLVLFVVLIAVTRR